MLQQLADFQDHNTSEKKSRPEQQGYEISSIFTSISDSAQAGLTRPAELTPQYHLLNIHHAV